MVSLNICADLYFWRLLKPKISIAISQNSMHWKTSKHVIPHQMEYITWCNSTSTGTHQIPPVIWFHIHWNSSNNVIPYPLEYIKIIWFQNRWNISNYVIPHPLEYIIHIIWNTSNNDSILTGMYYMIPNQLEHMKYMIPHPLEIICLNKT